MNILGIQKILSGKSETTDIGVMNYENLVSYIGK